MPMPTKKELQQIKKIIFEELQNDPRMEIIELNNQIMYRSGQIFKCMDKIAELNTQINDNMTKTELEEICKKINKITDISRALEKEINKYRSKSDKIQYELDHNKT